MWLQMDRNYRMRLLLGFSACAYVALSVLIKVFGENVLPNRALFYLINGNQLVSLNPLMVYASEYGREFFWIPVVALIWILGGDKQKRVSFLMAVAFVLAIILGIVSKHVMAEPRPFEVLGNARVLLPKPTDYSYPSGHAVIVSTGAIVALIGISRKVSVPLTVEALIVSYSRVYVGVHWPADILGGWLMGSVCASSAFLLAGVLERVYNLIFSAWSRILGG